MPLMGHVYADPINPGSLLEMLQACSQAPQAAAQPQAPEPKRIEGTLHLPKRKKSAESSVSGNGKPESVA